ncbi:MAG: long-chain fatty acid--CoA ligase [Litorimonas sp.]
MTIFVRDWVEHHAVTTPNNLALIDLASGRKFTYAQMHERVAQTAGFLKARGIKRGDRVAFLTLNTTDVMELVFGCFRIGAICLALNFRLTPPELAFILNDAKGSLVLVDTPFAALAEATKPLTQVIHWVTTDGLGGSSDFETELANATPVYEMIEQDIEDQCLLMYSSGTTGRPKGVIITHAMLDFTNSAAARMGHASPDNNALSNMPVFHIAGLNVTSLPTIWAGGTCIMMRVFDPDATLQAINNDELGINIVFMVPAAYNALKAHPDVEKIDFSRLEVALCGAETVPAPLVKWWLDKNVIIQEGYGMTETSAAGCLLAKDDIPHKIGSAGKCLIHSQIQITNENGQACAPNETGEIWFKGAVVTPGYWRNPEANAEAFVNGWFRSGDIGRKDEDGFIYIEDRLKDMYISGGENVYPAEIEGLLYELPNIVEVSVIGVSDTRWGETGCVIAVFKDGQTMTLEAILAHLSGRLAKYKQPSYLHIVDALPRGGTGKVLKFELRNSVPDVLNLT